MRELSMARGEASRHDRILAALAAGLSAALLLFGCEGSATQTTTGIIDSGISGVLVDPQGRPAARAMVSAWPANSSSPIGQGNTPLDIAYTDAQGRYALDLEAGSYNVFAQAGQGSLAAGITGVNLPDSGLDLGESTLLPPGSVAGRVLAGDSPAADVFCFIPGSAFVTMTDSSGRFALAQVPPGTYLFRYVAVGYVPVTDTITVGIDSALSLPDLQLAPDLSLQPPTLSGFSAALDTVTGLVSLRWNAVHVQDLAGYVVEFIGEGNTSNEYERSWLLRKFGPLKDTVFVDKEAAKRFDQMQKLYLEGPLVGAAPRDSVRAEYRVKAVDKDGNSSPAYVSSVLMLRRPSAMRTDVRMSVLGLPADSTRCLDTLAVAAEFANPEFREARFQWWVKGLYPKYGPLYIYRSEEYVAPDRWAETDTLRWYWGKPPAVVPKEGIPALPTALHFKVQVGFDIPFAARVKFLEVQVDSAGCFRAGALRDPNSFGE